MWIGHREEISKADVSSDKDLTSANQQIVKSTINDLIVKQELPATLPISS